MKLVGEFKYGGDVHPGCGTKVVARTHRGTELAEMLTTTCENSGCGKSVSRSEMLEYINNSGGHDYPFSRNGRVLRVATVEDLNASSGLEVGRAHAVQFAKKQISELNLEMKLVEVELILGGELMTFYYTSEDRVDFRELVVLLAAEFKTRIEMRQVGARDEARLTADYERCGQYCCCKNFLKVLKPVSMGAAKMQKATLDPLKISGRCGRLMCCLRYEDQTYRELKKNLPHRRSRVGTPEGPGIVVDSRTLVQLVLVRLEDDGREIAVPVEDLMDPEKCPPPGTIPVESDPLRGMESDRIGGTSADSKTPEARRKKRRRSSGAKADRPSSGKATARQGEGGAAGSGSATDTGSDAKVPETGEGRKKRRRRGRRRRGGEGGGDAAAPKASGGSGGNGGGARESRAAGDGADSAGGEPKRRRRRRRRRKPGGGGGSAEG